ncbi:Mitochondrial glycine transporter [Podosphaera aphanis]|nr:Mitochondrial glycine transporter [Podosphaera aphanis]
MSSDGQRSRGRNSSHFRTPQTRSPPCLTFPPPDSECDSFLAGLGSGISSATLLQPADLLKTRLQQSGSSSLLVIIREISSHPNSLLSFWRGTLPSALRTGFGSAIYFSSLNTLRGHVARSGAGRVALVGHEAPRHSSSLPELSNAANLTTGAVARAAAGLVLMPMTVIKVRYESNLYAYRSILGAARDILRTEGVKGFMAGLGATTARDAPYAGLYVLFYEQFKKRFSALSQQTLPDRELPSSMNGPKSASINFGSSMVAAGLATAITNPFDAIKTRIQLQPEVYRNVFCACTKMMHDEGPRSLFDGLALRICRKALSSALAWTFYEEVIRRAEMAWKQETSE